MSRRNQEAFFGCLNIVVAVVAVAVLCFAGLVILGNMGEPPRGEFTPEELNMTEEEYRQTR